MIDLYYEKNNLIILFIIPLKVAACDCDILNPTLEFYESDFVFKGVVKSKMYSEDSLTYEISFKVLRHFKLNDKKPNSVDFKLKSESDYTGMWTSCDWSIYKNQTWLVYARKNDSGVLEFSGICSNSRNLDKRPLSSKQIDALVAANDFKLSEYVFFNELNFNNTLSVTNIDSIIKKGKIKKYKNSFTSLKLHIDSDGNLLDVIPPKNLKQVIDKTNGLARKVINTNKKPLSLFEKDAVELFLKVKKWEVKKHKKTNVPVNYIKHISIQYNTKSNEWSYEF